MEDEKQDYQEELLLDFPDEERGNIFKVIFNRDAPVKIVVCLLEMLCLDTSYEYSGRFKTFCHAVSEGVFSWRSPH